MANTKPKVSILLPNLNNIPFLEERIETILNQTFTDWELIIVDSYSNDGAWELLQEYARQNNKIKISQAPRKGVYAGINDCLKLSRGEYIYIATSDDTMMPKCLEKMVKAMDAYPKCEICHTLLQVIDDEGKEIPNWWNRTPPARFYGELVNKPHIRLAPYDGILYCALRTVYISLTQLLIRRSVFDKVGLFPTTWGSEGDFEWCMRAALVCNTIHIPETLATWRIHSQQATKTSISRTSPQYRQKFRAMIQSALTILEKNHLEIYNKLQSDDLFFFYHLIWGLKEKPTKKQKFLFFLSFLTINSKTLLSYLLIYLHIKRDYLTDEFIFLRQKLKKLGIEKNIEIIDL